MTPIRNPDKKLPYRFFTVGQFLLHDFEHRLHTRRVKPRAALVTQLAANLLLTLTTPAVAVHIIRHGHNARQLRDRLSGQPGSAFIFIAKIIGKLF